jgi:RDD family
VTGETCPIDVRRFVDGEGWLFCLPAGVRSTARRGGDHRRCRGGHIRPAVVRRHLTNASAIRRLAVPTAIQGAYFTIATAVAGGSPGQLLVGLRVVDVATGRRPSWPQALSRWWVLAGPGTVARVVIAGSRNPSAKRKVRLAILRGQQDRLAEELSGDADQLDERLPALHSGRRTAALWAPPAVTVILLLVYKLTLGRGAHDRLSNTRVVATR